LENELDLAIENLVLAGAVVEGMGNDNGNVITGNDLNNGINGLDGEDVLNGGGGNDILIGSHGADILNGGLGNDTLIAAEFFGAADADNNDYLFGDEGDDSLIGGLGADFLDGGTGVDTLKGGMGDDTYVVDHLADMVTELEGGGEDTVIWATPNMVLNLATNVENIEIVGASTDEFHVFGNSLNNKIWGSGGADEIHGLGGDDTLVGGYGSDAYRYSRGDGTDIIYEENDYWLTDAFNVLYLSDVAWDQMWFQHVAGTDDLKINAMGNANDNVIISNWFADPSYQLAIVSHAPSGAGSVNLAQMNNLVQTMAGMGDFSGQQALTVAQAAAVDQYWAFPE
jgi:Ca2+-binding RTX toxin-like protein